MRTHELFICMISVPLLITACHTYEANQQEAEKAAENMLVFTKAEFKPDAQFFVTEEDVMKYVKFHQLAGRLSSLRRIIPMNYLDYTTGYVIEDEDGWEMISSDKRGPIILGQGEGEYIEEEMPMGTKAWIGKLNQDVAYRWSQSSSLN